MSTVLILYPIVTASWPVIVSVAGSAAAALGLAAKEAARNNVAAGAKQAALSEEVEMEDSSTLQDAVNANKELTFARGDVTITVKKNQRGRISVCASSEKNIAKSDLKQAAKEFSEKMVQYYAYNKLMNELKTKGFQVVDEQVTEGSDIHIHVRRWEG